MVHNWGTGKLTFENREHAVKRQRGRGPPAHQQRRPAAGRAGVAAAGRTGVAARTDRAAELPLHLFTLWARYKSYDVRGTAEAGGHSLSIEIIDKPETFRGSASLDTKCVGVASLVGTLTAEDSSALYQKTVAFTFESSGLGFRVYFLDDKDTKLGMLDALPVNNVIGSGKGTGTWSEIRK
ncbi:hypothetical protein O6H91_23G053200 [Diphasiastrum complanatum]|uniref:Uncharacterized protein n=1 Tax=Diphasiastrum complanatum TaxID=34168 RepID=A0ACC2AAM2_DIPCM|nr:hypothetical protein O6H91_23G053200 [Diphasiastrum complanatum]